MSEKKKYRAWTVQQKLEIVLASLCGDRLVAELCREHQNLREPVLHVAGQAARRRRRAPVGKEERTELVGAPQGYEAVLARHPAVSSVAVIGVPDEKWGEAVKAVVVRKPGKDVAAEELIDLVKDAKGSAHAPKSIDFIAAMPLTPLAKPDKQTLRAAHWAGQSRSVS